MAEENASENLELSSKRKKLVWASSSLAVASFLLIILIIHILYNIIKDADTITRTMLPSAVNLSDFKKDFYSGMIAFERYLVTEDEAFYRASALAYEHSEKALEKVEGSEAMKATLKEASKMIEKMHHGKEVMLLHQGKFVQENALGKKIETAKTLAMISGSLKISTEYAQLSREYYKNIAELADSAYWSMKKINFDAESLASRMQDCKQQLNIYAAMLALFFIMGSGLGIAIFRLGNTKK